MLVRGMDGKLSEFEISIGLLTILLLGNISFFNSYLGPSKDSATFHFPNFVITAEYLKNSLRFPDWYPGNGGIRAGFLEMNFGTLSPHRLIGYLLYRFTDINPVVLYKFTLALGVWFIAFGTSLLISRWLKSFIAALLAGVVICFGGIAVTNHHEQVIFTLIWTPWILLCFYEMKNDKRWLIPTLAILGLLTTQHYPQIQITSLGLYGIFSIMCWPGQVLVRLKIVINAGWKIWLVSLALFLMAASTLPYITKNIANLSSPYRSNIVAENYEQFIKLNKEQGSSPQRDYMNQYIEGGARDYYEWPDRQTFFLGIFTIYIAILGFILGGVKALLVVFLTYFFTMLTLGVYSYIPIVDWLYLAFPWLFKSFRQWFHFLPLQQLSLVILFSIGLVSIQKFLNFFNIKVIFQKLLFTFISIGLLVNLVTYRNLYIQNNTAPYANFLFTQNGIRERIQEFVLPQIMRYKNQDKLCLNKDEAISKPYFADPVIIQQSEYIADMCELRVQFGKNVALLSNSQYDLPKIQIAGNQLLDEFVDHRIAHFRVKIISPSLFVTNINYDLGVSASIDGKKLEHVKVNEALVGVWLTKEGIFDLQITSLRDYYSYSQLLKVFAILIIAFSIVFLLRIKKLK
jgi:hypothetical protein